MSIDQIVMDMGASNERSEYAGYWIALVDNKVVAKEKGAKAAYTGAKEQHPSKVPFIMQVPAEDVMLL